MYIYEMSTIITVKYHLNLFQRQMVELSTCIELVREIRIFKAKDPCHELYFCFTTHFSIINEKTNPPVTKTLTCPFLENSLFEGYRYNQVSMVVADVSVPLWSQVICNNHAWPRQASAGEPQCNATTSEDLRNTGLDANKY